ncbi:N-acetylneuraminate synthase [Dissulfuribacter thermophilus]|uniref:N-acetylneuraminate synthase n=1 Tax=Dissulfuribacter thermophilus TaxID=1156395 RepID=A0A1B9F2X4_9BACT|nr:N-acetylneuraminate synthase [Dissulfuribacter thermophilus]OCC14165.1 N-acetylneuraminate synthase [Dissulfuribacter thermophilus]
MENSNKVFIIAEAGVNHNGSVEIAHKMIDEAKSAGADCIKFQVFNTEALVSRDAPTAQYQKEKTGETEQYSMLKALELKKEEILCLKKHCENIGIEFLATPFDLESVEFLSPLVSRFKIGSGDITNFPLLELVAKKGKPVILSTGMASLGEIEDAFWLLAQHLPLDYITLLHCVSIYPTPPELVNLNVIHTLKTLFKTSIGFSDHSIGINMAIAAVAIGATVIEKHFTLDKKLKGPDHNASVDPVELKMLIKAVKEVEVALGNGLKCISDAEAEIKRVVRRGLYARRDIKAGQTLNAGDIIPLRPEKGIPSRFFNKVLGLKSNTDIKQGTPLEWWMLRPLRS